VQLTRSRKPGDKRARRSISRAFHLAPVTCPYSCAVLVQQSKLLVNFLDIAISSVAFFAAGLDERCRSTAPVLIERVLARPFEALVFEEAQSTTVVFLYFLHLPGTKHRRA